MKSLIAFTKKEWLEQTRSGKLTILGILFTMFGIMNPAVAKLTPWMLEMFAETLEGSGIVLTSVEVSALDSWVQFFKNIPMALIAFILLESSIFTREYQTGTLVLSLTKGLERYKVVISKTAVISLLWTLGYFICFIITYLYNDIYWDNSIAKSLVPSVIHWWVFGLWIVSLMVLFSVASKGSSVVLLGCGGAVLLSYLIGLIPKCSKYLPTYLTDGNSLIYGAIEASNYSVALIVTVASAVIFFAASIPIFNRRQL